MSSASLSSLPRGQWKDRLAALAAADADHESELDVWACNKRLGHGFAPPQALGRPRSMRYEMRRQQHLGSTEHFRLLPQKFIGIV